MSSVRGRCCNTQHVGHSTDVSPCHASKQSAREKEIKKREVKKKERRHAEVFFVFKEEVLVEDAVAKGKSKMT